MKLSLHNADLLSLFCHACLPMCTLGDPVEFSPMLILPRFPSARPP
jgi:hypothetical protein